MRLFTTRGSLYLGAFVREHIHDEAIGRISSRHDHEHVLSKENGLYPGDRPPRGACNTRGERSDRKEQYQG